MINSAAYAEPEVRTKTVTKTVWDWELMNTVKPLWTRSPSEVTDEEYKEFMTEVIGIANSYRQVKMRVIAWACHVDERDDIEVTNDTQERLLANKFYGGGGTELSCLTRYMESKEYKSRLLVVLTDGYIEGNPSLPDGTDCLFVLSRNGSSEVVKHYGDVTSLNDTKR